jgi:hypothetical protein
MLAQTAYQLGPAAPYPIVTHRAYCPRRSCIAGVCHSHTGTRPRCKRLGISNGRRKGPSLITELTVLPRELNHTRRPHAPARPADSGRSHWLAECGSARGAER